MITVDLKTTYVPSSRRVWRCFPGEGYRFFDHFRNGMIFVDVPNLELQQERMVGANLDLHARVAASRAHAFQLRGLIEPTVKSPNWREFTHIKVDPPLDELVASVKNFYDDACPGDVVVVPEPVRDEHILFGQILTRQHETEATYYERQYGQSRLDGKRVEWLARVNQKFLSPVLLHSLRHENNFTAIAVAHYAEIFAFCFNNFMWEGLFGSTLHSKGQYFGLYDNAIIGFISSLTAAACDKSSLDRAERLAAAGYDYLDIILGSPDLVNTSQAELDIRLPSYFRSLSREITPIAVSGFIGLMISLGSCSTLAEFQSELPHVQFINPQAGPDGHHCTALVQSASMALLEGVPQHDLWKLCKKLEALAHRSDAGLDPHVQVFREERSSSAGHEPL